MRRINLPLVSDTLFVALCAFLLFFTSIRFYTRNPYVALGFAIVACLLFGALGFLYVSKKQNKKFLRSRDEKGKKLLSLHLSLSSDKYVSELLKKCLAREDEKPQTRNGGIIIGDCAYFYNFKMQPVSEDDAAKVIKIKTEKNKILLCNRISPEGMLLCENFLIEVKQIDYIYGALKKKELLPEKYAYEGQKTNPFKRIRARFSRKICAPLFWSGLALLALSYFTFFPVYYIVSGGIMLILSASALVFN